MLKEDATAAPGLEPSVVRRGWFSGSKLQRRLRIDRWVRGLVTFGGWIIIGSILAILFVIVAEIAPLFKSPQVSLQGVVSLDRLPLAVGVDEYREVAYVVDSSGITFVSLERGEMLPLPRFEDFNDAKVTAVSPSVRGFPVLGLSDGNVLPVKIHFNPVFKNGNRAIQPELEPQEPLLIHPEGQPVRKLAHIAGENGWAIASVVGPETLGLVQVEEKRTLMGTVRKKISRQTLTLPVRGSISALAFEPEGEKLFLGTTSGQVLMVPFTTPDPEKAVETVGATRRSGVGVTRLGFLLGGFTLVMGDSEGGVTSFHLRKGKDGKQRLVRIQDFASHDRAAILFSSSLGDKAFLTGGSTTIQVHYGTTGETQLRIQPPGTSPLRAVSLAPKGDGLIAADASGRLVHWTLENPHPQVTLKSLFGEIWYEGYAHPETVWQSTGGSDAFEPKFSLVPLIFGTLKGTLYALLFSVPLALCGAFYTSQFMHPTLKGVVKPAIELMAALPSVVLGFFAGLIIAPEVERFLPGVVLMPLVIAVLTLLALGFYMRSRAFRARMRQGTEIYLLVPLTFAGGMLALYLGTWVESLWMQGDHRTWLYEMFAVTYDQRNALVVGLAMGFAVIPIIFTMAEDSLSNVPEHLKASSLALGATPWQTAMHVILPTASPGIFSAVMIGFGRAVGETMIVLMATGNTPLMEWSIFNGFRALSANIAVELPEAPEGGSLFRILFLAAFLLFVMTFLINTAAEVVRLRLRKRYRVL